MSAEEENVIRKWLDLYLPPAEQRIDSSSPLLPQIRSGATLCKALNGARANSIKRVAVGTMTFVHKENVQSFIAACEALGVKETFAVDDLLEMKNQDKIYKTIIKVIRLVCTPESLPPSSLPPSRPAPSPSFSSSSSPSPSPSSPSPSSPATQLKKPAPAPPPRKVTSSSRTNSNTDMAANNNNNETTPSSSSSSYDSPSTPTSSTTNSNNMTSTTSPDGPSSSSPSSPSPLSSSWQHVRGQRNSNSFSSSTHRLSSGEGGGGGDSSPSSLTPSGSPDLAASMLAPPLTMTSSSPLSPPTATATTTNFYQSQTASIPIPSSSSSASSSSSPSPYSTATISSPPIQSPPLSPSTSTANDEPSGSSSLSSSKGKKFQEKLFKLLPSSKEKSSTSLSLDKSSPYSSSSANITSSLSSSGGGSPLTSSTSSPNISLSSLSSSLSSSMLSSNIPPSEVIENSRLRTEMEKLYADRRVLRERVQFNFPEKYKSLTVFDQFVKADEAAHPSKFVVPEGVTENEHLRKEEVKVLQDIFRLTSILSVVEENRALQIRLEELQKMIEAMMQDKKNLQARIDELLADKAQAELQTNHEEGLVWSDYKGKKQIKAGTPEKLVERVYSKNVTGSVSEYVDTFLLTYRSFTTSRHVFEIIADVYNRNNVEEEASSSSLGDSGGNNSSGGAGIQLEQDKLTKKKLRLRICNFLKRWVDFYFHDFDSDLVNEFNSFIVAQLQYNKDDSIMLLLKKALDKKLNVGPAGGLKVTTFSTPTPPPILPKSWATGVAYNGPVFFDDLDEKEIARQLTVVEYDFYKNIAAKELLSLGWQKSDRDLRSPNLLKMITQFNHVNNWIVCLIVREPVLRKRATILRKILRIAEELRKLNNFNAVFVIVSALHNASINRLKRTWEELGRRDEKLFEELDVLTSPNGSFSTYREDLHGANPPCIPYMGVYLSDLTFIEEGNPDEVENGLVNFFKCRMVSEVIKWVQQYQQKPYNLTPVPAIINWIVSHKILTDSETFKLSLQAEPREPAATQS